MKKAEELAQEDLLRSGLALKGLEKFVKVLNTEQITKVFKGNTKFLMDCKLVGPPLGALGFLYYSSSLEKELEVQAPEYIRYKLYWPPLQGFHASLKKDPRAKYLQNVPNAHIYVAPNFNWEEFLADKDYPWAIAEGEKKALKAANRGLPCVAVGGKDSFYAAGTKDLHPLLKFLCKTHKELLIPYDVDEGSNAMRPDVAKSAMKLASLAQDAGANPLVITLPKDSPEKKVALDDWLSTKEMENASLEEIVEHLGRHALATNTAKLLYEEAAKSIYIPYVTAVGVVSTRKLQSEKSFRTDKNNHQVIVNSLAIDKKSSMPIQTLVVKRLGDAFLEWPGRPQAVGGVGYFPGNPDAVVNEIFNRWAGYAQEVPDRVVTKEEVKPLFTVIEKFLPIKEEAEYFLNWLLWPLANPGKKLSVVPILRHADEGIGKSRIGELLSVYVYGNGLRGMPYNAATLNVDSIHNPRGTVWVEKQFIMIDDVSDLHDMKLESLIKSVTGISTINVDPKYKDEYTGESIAALLINSNRKLPIKLGETDRRFFIPEINLRMTKEDWGIFEDFLKKGGGGLLVAFAKNFKFDKDFNPFRAMLTEEKKNLIKLSRTDAEQILIDLVESARAKVELDKLFESGASIIGEELEERKARAGVHRVICTPEEIRQKIVEDSGKRLEDISGLRISAAMERAGAQSYQQHRQVWINPSVREVYILADFEKYQRMEPKEIANIFKQYPVLKGLYGVPTPKKKKFNK